MASRCHSIPAYFANLTLQKERGLLMVSFVVHKMVPVEEF